MKKEAFIRRISCEAEIMEKQKEEQRRVKALKTLYTAWNGGRRISLNMVRTLVLASGALFLYFNCYTLLEKFAKKINKEVETSKLRNSA